MCVLRCKTKVEYLYALAPKIFKIFTLCPFSMHSPSLSSEDLDAEGVVDSKAEDETCAEPTYCNEEQERRVNGEIGQFVGHIRVDIVGSVHAVALTVSPNAGVNFELP